jgi:NAD(P)-dependent dehydrogenase (short-subunit alcohol dehydrogenase family)
VTQPDTIAAIARKCTDVNLLINNAGISRWTGFLASDAVEAARSEMETNYFGPLLLSRAFAPVLAMNGGGAIVNVLSILSWISVPSAGELQRIQGRCLVFDELVAHWFAWARYASCGGARRSDRYRHGKGSHASEGHYARRSSASAQCNRGWSR